MRQKINLRRVYTSPQKPGTHLRRALRGWEERLCRGLLAHRSLALRFAHAAGLLCLFRCPSSGFPFINVYIMAVSRPRQPPVVLRSSSVLRPFILRSSSIHPSLILLSSSLPKSDVFWPGEVIPRRCFFFLSKKQGFLDRTPKAEEIPPWPCICPMAMILIFGYRRRQIPSQNP